MQSLLNRYLWTDVQSWSQSRLAAHVAIPSVRGQGDGEQGEQGDGRGEEGDRGLSVETKQAPAQQAAQKDSRILPETGE